MKDQFGREISYLRLSITERCTLRCVYCRSEEGLCPKAAELTADQLIEVTRACAELGVNKVRVTGGEPLLRRDLIEIVAGIRAIPEIKDVSLTTNAQDLANQAAGLKTAGLDRINISMDSLDPDKFERMTNGNLMKVLEGIEKAIEVGLAPIKINCVLIKGTNDDEVGDFIEFTRDHPIDVRFIEYMPIGNDSEKVGINNQDILAAFPELEPVPSRYAGQPSRDYQIKGYQGRVGLISPISRRFCTNCNRIRMMSDGTLRACLGQESEVCLRPALDQGHEAIRDLIEKTIYNKPRGHNFGREHLNQRNMSRIGG